MTSETNELLWRGRQPARHGPKPTLTLEAITTAAVAIADEQGLDAVSMQAVADVVGFTKMSLYRHVASKSELVAVMIEQAVGEPPTFQRRTSWRRRITTWADRLAEQWRRHPWLPDAATGHRAMGPREIAWTECVLAALEDLELTPSERMDIAFLLAGLMRSTQSLESSGTHAWYEPAHRSLLEDRAEEFPATLAVVTAQASADLGRAFGLTLVLDGVQAMHDRRTG